MAGFGTVVNVAAILVGGTIGLILPLGANDKPE